MDYIIRRFDSLDAKVQSIETSVDEFKKAVFKTMEADREEQRRFMQSVQSFMDTYNANSFKSSYTVPVYEVQVKKLIYSL